MRRLPSFFFARRYLASVALGMGTLAAAAAMTGDKKK